ncbi:MAG: sigma-70 family RNA polymerase sigma factor [Verrucomicrobia bacterium]|nr:sigma-70 family RNA polymerase sigma factor [Verrucomicrobiota bacterium]
MSDDLVEQNLGLARMIAYEYANIPGASMDEVVAEAENALAAAGRSFDPEKGQFTAYAGRAMRNALNSFFTRQLRYVKVHEFSLDAEPPTSASTGSPARNEHADPGADVALAARAAESRRILEDVLAELPPRSRVIVTRIREGKSYSEIGEELNVSKQAIHKVAHAALQSLREKLDARGFTGIDSKGFLKSASKEKPIG